MNELINPFTYTQTHFTLSVFGTGKVISWMDLTIANQGGGNSGSNVVREYRKGNWTFQETTVLIEAKRMDDERRMRRVERGKPAELRWKWVEDYCWKNGCLRSQNQCNDKWDNLMRDFKKVREYERRVAEREKSYWRLDKNQRKDNNLPSNMLPQIYEALVEVVERKGQGLGQGQTRGVSAAAAGTSNMNVPEKPTLPAANLIPPVILQQPITQSPEVPLTLPPPPAEPRINLPFSQTLPTVDSDTSEYTESPAKRRKRRREGLEEVGSAISKSASMIAEAIQSSEEREERRHREILRLQERRLHIEESKAEINREGLHGLVHAINKLADSILALASHTNQPPPPPPSSN